MPDRYSPTMMPVKKDRYSKKSSQACDNCRRRKVRCDISDRLNGARCSICESQDQACTFEHIPRQRGPARGFKLAKRQKTEKDNLSTGNAQRTDDKSLLRPENLKRKVSDSSSHSDLFGHAGMLSSAFHHHEANLVLDLRWVQHAIERWFVLYQPTFAVLEEDMRVDGFSSDIHPQLQIALLLAIYSITYRSRTVEKADAMLAEQQLSAYNTSKSQDECHVILNRLTYLQITILLAIEADQRGYDVAQSVHTVGYWLGQATGQAYDLKLHREDWTHSDPALLVLGRRLFLILIVLDRWHSVSTSSPPFVPDTNAKFEIELPFSGITNHLYHLSLLIGDVYKTMICPWRANGQHKSADQDNQKWLGAQERLRAAIETWRGRVDVIWGQSNLLHVAYWHLCILSLSGVSSKGGGAIELREYAMRIASTLPNSATPYTPLNHHFFALTTCVLSHLLTFQETRPDAKKGLMNLKEAIERHKELITEDDSSWDHKLLQVIEALQTQPKPFAPLACSQHRTDPSMLLSSIRRRGYLLSIDRAPDHA